MAAILLVSWLDTRRESKLETDRQEDKAPHPRVTAVWRRQVQAVRWRRVVLRSLDLGRSTGGICGGSHRTGCIVNPVYITAV